MSTPVTEQTPPTAPVESTPPQGDPADQSLGENGEKALKAERLRAATAEKIAAALQKQLDDINAANLSDLEKAQKQANDARAEADEAKADALRFRIAAESGITENAELILTGSDEATMRKQAQLWSTRPPAGPRPDLSQGAKGSTLATGDPAQDFANFLGAQMST